MHSKTKIVVLHMKELIYTGIFVALGILFIMLLILMFFPKNNTTTDITETLSGNGITSYIPGVYTTSIALNDYTLDVEVVVDETSITSLRLVNMDENITSIYPLIQPAFDSIAQQLEVQQALDNITYEQESTYTSQLLLSALDTCISKALPTTLEEN